MFPLGSGVATFNGILKSGLFKKIPTGIDIYSDSVGFRGCRYIEETQSIGNVEEYNVVKYQDLLAVDVITTDTGRMIVLTIYNPESVVKSSRHIKFAIPGINDFDKCYDSLHAAWMSYKQDCLKVQEKSRSIKLEAEQKQLEKEHDDTKFYRTAYQYHIGQEDRPNYPINQGHNKWAGVYLNKNKDIVFLSIIGESRSETAGIIKNDFIHYYEKAGVIHFVPNVSGSSYGGSFTGSHIDNTRAVAFESLFFGTWGLSHSLVKHYKPASMEFPDIQIDTTVDKIDDRNVILNYYSESKKQYLDMELPADIYNFLQTYLPEKKYAIVEELEKQTAVSQSAEAINAGSFLKSPEARMKLDKKAEVKSNPAGNTTEAFREKVEKLKIMKESGLLDEEEFATEKKKLLDSI